MNYPHDIESLHQRYAVPVMVGDVNLDQQIHQGDVLNPEHLRQAAFAAGSLRLALGVGNHNNIVNEEIVRAAELRARAVENIHAGLEWGPGDLVQQLQDMNNNLQNLTVTVQNIGVDVNNLTVDVDNLTANVDNLTANVDNLTANVDNLTDDVNDLTLDVQIGRAETNNAITRMRNWLANPGVVLPVQKTVPGSGLDRALAITGHGPLRVALLEWANAHPDPEAIGALPPQFDCHTLTHTDILKLVYFYNEDMGIGLNFRVERRRETVRNFLINI